MKGRLTGLTRELDGGYNLTIQTHDSAVVDLYNDLREAEIEATVKKWHRKRSLTANGYAWVLIDKIAEAVNLTKVEVYRHAISHIGGVSTVVCSVEKAAPALIAGWSTNGLGWFGDIEESKINGCVNVRLYYGSSSYDSKQMAALIDALIQEAKQLGIETLPPREIDAMNAAWAAREQQ